MRQSPILLVLVNGHTTGAEVDDHEQATNDGSDLEEVVLDEVARWLVRGDVPPRVEVKVQHGEPGNQDQSRELRLEAHHNEDHQGGSYDVDQELHD